MHNSTIKQHVSNMVRPDFVGTLPERILSNQYYRPSNIDLASRNYTRSSNEVSRWRTEKDPNDVLGSFLHKEDALSQCRKKPIELNPLKQRVSLDIDPKNNLLSLGLSVRETSGVKRKASELGLDLDLSLGLESRSVNETLSLSLDTTSPASSKIMKKMQEDFITRNARGTSTLDLTL